MAWLFMDATDGFEMISGSLTGGTFKAAWFFLAGFLLSIHYPVIASLPSLARLSSLDPGYCF